MGLRFRRSVKLAPGVRLSVSKTGLGLSAGVRGARYSVHTSGRETTTLGIPGTGVSCVSTSGGGRGRRQRAGSGGRQYSVGRVDQSYASGAQAAALLPKPGLFAGDAEKRYHEGLVSYLRDDKPAALRAFEAALVADPTVISAHLLATLSSTADDDTDLVIRHLEALVTSTAPFPDRLMSKFLPPERSQLAIGVKITELVQARVPVDLTGATLLLAEAYQLADRLEHAIGLVQQLHQANPGDTAIRLSLADLLLADGDFEGVVEVTSGITNQDDVSLAIVHMRAAALVALGHQTAAMDAFKEALAKTTKRDPELLNTVRYDRALTLEQAGQHSRAKADYERLYATDPNYRDVRSRLANL